MLQHLSAICKFLNYSFISFTNVFHLSSEFHSNPTKSATLLVYIKEEFVYVCNLITSKQLIGQISGLRH